MKRDIDSKLEDFAGTIMALVSLKSSVTVYRPLISKPVFAGVLVCFIAAFIYLPDNSTQQTNCWITYLNFIPVDSLVLSSAFEFSKITTYTIAFATFVLFVQILLLKKHFDNQLEKYK
jgi:hypothetical protein